MSDKPTVGGAALGQHAVSFEGLLEAAPDAMVGVDQAGVIRFVNRQTESLFGYDRTDLVGQSIEMLVPESFRKVHPALRARYFADPAGTPAMGVVRKVTGRHRDGTELPVDISLSFIETVHGLLVTAAIRDITERIKADQELQQMAAIIQNSDAAIIGRNLDGIVTSWNPAAERMLGYSRQEMVGKPVEFLVPEDRTGEMNTIMARIKAGLDVDHFETVRARKDGTVFPVRLSVSPIRDANGAVVGASTITRDMTKEKEAFDAARSMIESSLDSLVAISPEGMITDANEATVKVTGIPREQLIGTAFSECFTEPAKANAIYQLAAISPEGMITDANEATVKVTGIPREQLIGTAFSECFTEPAKANAIYQLVFEQGRAVDYPLTMRHRDGTLTEVLYNASVYRDAGGKVLGVFAAARDVTEQKHAAETARSLAAAEDLVRTVMASASIGIALAGLDGSFRVVNRALCD